MNPGFIVLAAVAAGAWAFSRWYSPRPEFPPIVTSADDPLMCEAFDKAKASMGEFMALLRAPHRDAVVKLYFVSNSDQVEHLWAEVLSAPGLTDDTLNVRLVTPPVTHTGRLDRRYTCKLSDVEDWQVRDAAGLVHGGFTQRAMYLIARRDGIQLPAKLLKHEDQYR
jgi:uncharacterized protein YegJ (DUF2314 family)